MLKQYAVCLADRIKGMDEININQPEIYFDVWKAMNGRYQQRVVWIVLLIRMAMIPLWCSQNMFRNTLLPSTNISNLI